MSLTWTRAAEVTAGERITSLQMRSLARAFNDRIRSGIGDSAWRIGMWWFNLFRQVRNPGDGGFVFPPQGEFFEIYQHLDPEHGTGQWPTAGPGEWEGANLANPMMQFVFGNPELDQEDNRIGNGAFPIWLTNDPPTTLAEFWELGKLQRGVYAPASGDQNVPALTAAQSWFKVSTAYYSPHGKSWGGYFPTPLVLLDDCGTTDTTGLNIPSLEVKFTGLRADADTSSLHGTITTDSDGNPVCTYAGSCPSFTEYVDVGHVQWILRMPMAYYVGVWNGTDVDVDRFPLEDWIEGPYTGQGALSRQDGGQLARALWSFDCDFRGTEAQRGSDPKIRSIAFDFQGFFTRQYLLAPSYGVNDGASIRAIYPSASVSTSQAAGTLLTIQPDGGTAHHCHAGFPPCGAFAQASGLSAACAVEVVVDGSVAATLQLTPDESGNASAVLWWDQQSDASTVQFRMKGAATLGVGGSITVELAELFAMKPDFWDAYLILRLSATGGGDQFQAGVDGSGRDQAFSAHLWSNYLRYGAVVNGVAAGPRTIAEWVTDNPVYDSARRLSRECMRIVRRQQMLSYEIVDGKSVLKLKRWAYGLYNTRADVFKGIAPSSEPMASGDLEHGRTYEVTGSGSITYRGGSYFAGQSFVCDSDATFQAHGAAQLWEAEGIIPEAFRSEWTNEWVGFLQLHCYHWAEDSIWKRDAYADYFTWNNRCLFYAGYGGSKAFNRHINYGYGVGIDPRPDGSGYDLVRLDESVQAHYLSPEAPTGYTFAEHANNTPAADADFYQSCQIYQPPYEIESCTSDHAGEAEIVTITFASRFQAVASADATFASNPVDWTTDQVTWLTDETHRTDDNAMRDYMRNQAVGDYPCPWRTGDSGAGSSVQFLPDNPFGSCNPHLVLIKLIPEPYHDGNESQSRSDSLVTIDQHRQCEIYLRAMCEGFVDGETSAEITCETATGSLYDFTFENLCFQAFGGRWIGAFSQDDRDDSPAGYGPLPNTIMRAEVHNRLASAINLLDRCRVMVPFTIECNQSSYSGSKVVTQDWGDTCSGSGAQRAIWTGTPPDAGTFVGESGWAECSSIPDCSVFSRINGCAALGAYEVTTARNVVTFRVVVDPDFEDAMDLDLWAACASSGQFLIRTTTQTYTPIATRVGSSPEASDCGSVANSFWDGIAGYMLDLIQPDPVYSCMSSSGGTYDAGTRGPSTTYSFCRDTLPNEYGPSGGTQISFELMSEPGFWITVPLADLEGD